MSVWKALDKVKHMFTESSLEKLWLNTLVHANHPNQLNLFTVIKTKDYFYFRNPGRLSDYSRASL